MQRYQQAETEDAEFLPSSLLALTSFTEKPQLGLFNVVGKRCFSFPIETKQYELRNWIGENRQMKVLIRFAFALLSCQGH